MNNVQALIFDVFGTLVDWRTSVARHTDHILGPLQLGIDPLAFADAWRGQYQVAMEEVRAGRLPFCTLDVLHRHNLDRVLHAWDPDGSRVSEADRQALNRAWHQLDAWPDVGRGLQALRRHRLLAPCSNGNISLMVDLARHNDWHWDAVLGAEVAGDYKPKPIVYQRACEALGLPTSQVMMVAAHSSDLAAAAACGLKTAFVARPQEFGPSVPPETHAQCAVDLEVGDLLELATRLTSPGL